LQRLRVLHGGLNAYVKTWYDQSGNGIILSNYCIFTASNSKWRTDLQSINMDNTDDYMVAVSNYTAQIQQSIFTVFQEVVYQVGNDLF
jgi:hypothetical protein